MAEITQQLEKHQVPNESLFPSMIRHIEKHTFLKEGACVFEKYLLNQLDVFKQAANSLQVQSRNVVMPPMFEKCLCVWLKNCLCVCCVPGGAGVDASASGGEAGAGAGAASQ